MTLLISHPSYLGHLTPAGHPERPDRLRAIAAHLDGTAFGKLERRDAVRGSREAILRVHPERFVTAIEEAVPAQGLVRIDADTSMSPGSWEAALHGVGAAQQGVDEILAGSARHVFCAVRPPGHHAETVRAMGFCLFNNAAIAARHAQKSHGLERVAIVDWDGHHGNGTQQVFWADASVMYCSTHEMPLYPGTGARSERGEHDTIVNAPLKAGDGGTEFRAAFETAILPRIAEFRPELMVISAGFDAHWRDPLANLKLLEADFAWATEQLMAIADRHCGGRVLSLLEGGYDLEGLAKSVGAHIDTLMRA